MTADEIRAAVEQKVAEKLPSLLFDRLIEQHKKHGFKSGCDCDLCITKRITTRRIAVAPRWMLPELVEQARQSFNDIVERSKDV